MSIEFVTGQSLLKKILDVPLVSMRGRANRFVHPTLRIELEQERTCENDGGFHPPSCGLYDYMGELLFVFSTLTLNFNKIFVYTIIVAVVTLFLGIFYF